MQNFILLLIAIAACTVSGLAVRKSGKNSIRFRIRRPGRRTVTGEFHSKPDHGLTYVRYNPADALRYSETPGYTENSFAAADGSILIDLRWIMDNFQEKNDR